MNKDKKIVLIDIDGTLADFISLVFDLMNKEEKDTLNCKDKDTFIRLVHDKDEKTIETIDQIYKNDENFFFNMKPMNGVVFSEPRGKNKCQNILEFIEKELDCIVFICTSPSFSNKKCEEGKKAWIKKYLGDFWLSRLVITKDKTVVFGDYLIDDKKEITGEIKPKWKHILFAEQTPVGWKYELEKTTSKDFIKDWSSIYLFKDFGYNFFDFI